MNNVIFTTKAQRMRTYAGYVMSAYNRARSCGKFENGRVNRALGLALKELATGETRPYLTTTKACNCKDAQFGNICQHIISKMIIVRALEYMQKDVDNVCHCEGCAKRRKFEAMAKQVESGVIPGDDYDVQRYRRIAERCECNV